MIIINLSNHFSIFQHLLFYRYISITDCNLGLESSYSLNDYNLFQHPFLNLSAWTILWVYLYGRLRSWIRKQFKVVTIIMNFNIHFSAFQHQLFTLVTFVKNKLVQHIRNRHFVVFMISIRFN